MPELYVIGFLLDQRLVSECYVVRFCWIRVWCLNSMQFVFVGSETGARILFYSFSLDQRLVPDFCFSFLLDQRLVPDFYFIRFYWIRDWCLNSMLFVFMGSETGA